MQDFSISQLSYEVLKEKKKEKWIITSIDTTEQTELITSLRYYKQKDVYIYIYIYIFCSLIEHIKIPFIRVKFEMLLYKNVSYRYQSMV